MDRARAFAEVAQEYERGRPTYAPAAIVWLLGQAPLDVLDLGAGTGKLTAALVAAGHRVTAVEPLAEMRGILTASLPEVTVVSATAEDTGLPDGCADAVVAGAAFHWFEHDRVFGEIARVLRRPGVLGLLGNQIERSEPWVEHLSEVLGSTPIGRGGRRVTPEELAAAFAQVEIAQFPHEQIVDRTRVLDLARSRSGIATLEPAARDRLLGRLEALWDEEPELIGRDQAALPYLTTVTRCAGVRG